jgi:hypothetical protein
VKDQVSQPCKSTKFCFNLRVFDRKPENEIFMGVKASLSVICS